VGQILASRGVISLFHNLPNTPDRDALRGLRIIFAPVTRT
jgi:hypothetical protein